MVPIDEVDFHVSTSAPVKSPVVQNKTKRKEPLHQKKPLGNAKKPRKRKARKRIAMPESYHERKRLTVDSRYTFHSYCTRSNVKHHTARSRRYQVRCSSASGDISSQITAKKSSENDVINASMACTPPVNKKNRQVSLQASVIYCTAIADVLPAGSTFRGFEQTKECVECTSEISGSTSLNISGLLCEKCITLLKQHDKTFESKILAKNVAQRSLLVQTLLNEHNRNRQLKVNADAQQKSSLNETLKRSNSKPDISVSKNNSKLNRPKRKCVIERQHQQQQQQKQMKNSANKDKQNVTDKQPITKHIGSNKNKSLEPVVQLKTTDNRQHEACTKHLSVHKETEENIDSTADKQPLTKVKLSVGLNSDRNEKKIGTNVLNKNYRNESSVESDNEVIFNLLEEFKDVRNVSVVKTDENNSTKMSDILNSVRDTG